MFLAEDAEGLKLLKTVRGSEEKEEPLEERKVGYLLCVSR